MASPELEFDHDGHPDGDITRKSILFEFLVGHMATQICQDSAGMNRKCTNFIRFAAPIEFDGEQNIRGFRLAVSLPPVIGTALKVRILEIHSRALVTA